MGLPGYKYEEQQFEENLKLNDDSRFFQKKFLDFVIEENFGYFEKRNNRKYLETLDELGNINEVINNPKKDKNGNDYYEMSYENIFGFISTKKFKNKADVEKYRDKIVKKNKDYLKNITSKVSSIDFESSIKKFFTSGKCPDYTTGSFSKDKILEDFTKTLGNVKDLFNKNESRVFFYENQISPLHKNILESINNLNTNEVEKINAINLDENQIMNGLSLSLNPEEFEEDLALIEDNCFKVKVITSNNEVEEIKDHQGNILNEIAISENASKDGVKKLINELIDARDLIDKLPWYKKFFTSQETDLIKKLNTTFDILENRGFSKELIGIYVYSDSIDRAKLDNILDEHIQSVSDRLASYIPRISGFGDKLEKHNLEKSIEEDFIKLNNNPETNFNNDLETNKIDISDDLFKNSTNSNIEKDDLDLPDEISNDDILKIEDYEVESNKNFISQNDDIVTDNDIVEGIEEIDIFKTK